MNFKSAKGATGADIIIAVSIIVLSVSVISMIYVNTTFQSRNVKRTAGATRIATNILENIEKMPYNDFCVEYGNENEGSPWTKITSGEYEDYKSTTNTTVFNTRIPRGYTLYLYGEPSYGSHVFQNDQFDLVRDIRITITYKVGDATEKVEFTSSKEREIIPEVNIPNVDVLTNQRLLVDSKKFYPIKYLDESNVYVKTTTKDSEWYNYSNKKWALVIVSSEDEGTLFDVNGKLVADSSKYTRYTWIPRFYYVNDGVKDIFSEFVYLTTDLTSEPKAIGEGALSSNGGSAELKYNSFVNKKSASEIATDMGNKTGEWIEATNQAKIQENNYGKILNESIYGPCELH